MIKIHLNNESEILDFHYDSLTVKVGAELNVLDRIDRAKRKLPNATNIFDFLKDKVLRDQTGYSILTAKPNELEDFIRAFEIQFTKASIDTYKDEFKKIFYYSDYDKWKADELAKKININVCPYCNRIYTFIINKGGKTRFEFDHFLSKSEYPYLALSFFNLVPSCHICNSNLKREIKFTLRDNIHPYVEGFSNNIFFSIRPKDISFINGNHSAYRVKIKRNIHSNWSNQKIKAAYNNITTFKLSTLYNMHKDYVDEIIQKSIIYNPKYISDLFVQFHGKLFKSEEDVFRFILGNYTEEENYNKRVLSKLTTDISKELGII